MVGLGGVCGDMLLRVRRALSKTDAKHDTSPLNPRMVVYFSVVIIGMMLCLPASAQNMPLTTRYIHTLRMSVRLPLEWTPGASLERGGRVNFIDADGVSHVEFEPFAHDSALDSACAEAARREGIDDASITYLSDSRGCTIVSLTSDYPLGLGVLRLPTDIVRGTGRFRYILM